MSSMAKRNESFGDIKLSQMSAYGGCFFTPKRVLILILIIVALIVIPTVIAEYSEKYGFKYVLSKILGSMIVCGSVFMKVPQIIKIFNEKSAEGLKATMFYLDYLMLLQVAAFSVYDELPFTVYGESFFLLVQDIIIII